MHLYKNAMMKFIVLYDKNIFRMRKRLFIYIHVLIDLFVLKFSLGSLKKCPGRSCGATVPILKMNRETQASHSCPQTSLERWVMAGSGNTQPKSSFLSVSSTPHSSWLHPKAKTITSEWPNNGDQICTSRWLMPKVLATLQSPVPLYLNVHLSAFRFLPTDCQWNRCTLCSSSQWTSDLP